MGQSESIKKLVREKYTEIAAQSQQQNASSCCGAGACCSGPDYVGFCDDYTTLEGYVDEANLGLGCGIPTAFAEIKEGDTVLDLGSGAGNDVFIARKHAGESGRVIGLDMTPIMVEKARENNAKLGFTNVEFVLGDIENMPVPANTADIVISNCVLNLVPDKVRAFGEIFRVMKPGGQFSISDVVYSGALPEAITSAAEMYVGCVAGAVQKDEYLDIIAKAGFTAVTVVKEKAIELSDELLGGYLTPEQLETFRASGAAILSITVSGSKPKA